MAEDWMSERSTHDLAFRWQRDDFHLESDAWVITNGRRQFAGFACVWHRDYEEFSTFLCVHPHYRKRGIGTLLLRLAEQRARELMCLARPGVRVSLRCRVSSKHIQARSLFEREGYLTKRKFWNCSNRATTSSIQESSSSISSSKLVTLSEPLHSTIGKESTACSSSSPTRRNCAWLTKRTITPLTVPKR